MSRTAGYTALPNSTPLARLAMSLAGQRVPCAGRTADWYADDAGDRAEAAQACLLCPVLTACDETAEANREQFGVWGGVDRQQVKRKRDRDRAKRDLELRNAA